VRLFTRRALLGVYRVLFSVNRLHLRDARQCTTFLARDYSHVGLIWVYIGLF